MSENISSEKEPVSKLYLGSVLLFMLILPLGCTLAEAGPGNWITVGGKWALFWGVGMRLLTAGFRQALKPAFTARDIFKIDAPAANVIVRELGFANICMGSTAVASLAFTSWRMAAAACGGLYFLLAGALHCVKKPVTPNEWIALVSDLFIAGVMAAYIALSWN